MMVMYRYHGDFGFCIGWRIIGIRMDTNLSVCFLLRAFCLCLAETR